MDEVSKARAVASQYNATARALKVGINGVPKRGFPQTTIRTRISEGDELAVQPSPELKANSAMEVKAEDSLALAAAVDEAAEESKEEEAPAVVESKVEDEPPKDEKSAEEPTTQSPEPSTENTATETEEKDSETKSEPETFTMPEVEQAIKEGKGDVLNEVLVRTFLEAVSPERAKDATKLLEEYKGKEEELMQNLLQESAPADVNDRSAESLVITPEDGESLGFITEGKVDSRTREWTVSLVKDPQMDALRSKLLARGLSETEIVKMMDESSEML